MAEIKGLPIFKPGSYHGGKYQYSLDDVKAMPGAFDETASAFMRPVKLTHQGKENPFAMGFIKRIAGDNSGLLFADLEGVPDEIVQAVKDRRILGTSAEIYPEFSFGGKTHKNVIRALSLEGANPPEVKGLGDLMTYFHAESEHDHVTIKFSDVPGEPESVDDTSSAVPDQSGSGETMKPKKEETTMDPIKYTDKNGVVHEFADNAALNTYITATITDATKDLVDKSELDKTREQLAAITKANHFAEVKARVATLATPNEKGYAIPEAVTNGLADELTAIPFGEAVIRFGEGDQAKPVLDCILARFDHLRKVGLVKLSETVPASKLTNDSDEIKTLKAEFAEMKDQGWIDASITEEDFIRANRKGA